MGLIVKGDSHAAGMRSKAFATGKLNWFVLFFC
jgi:hypothetical protein